MSDEVSDPDVTEARRVSQAIMEDICNELFGLGSSAAAPQASAASSAGDATSSGPQQNEDFFKTLSFYDDDDPLDLPFEDINYDDPNEILDFIANIHTPVGFCDVSGYNPEHNFRFNHTSMEL